MTNSYASKVLVHGDWYYKLSAEYLNNSEEHNELIEAVGKAAEALRYEVSIIENNHFATLEITVPKGTKVSRILVTEEGKRFGSLYYPE